MAGLLLPPGKQQFFDINGDPLVGGFVYFYIPDTDTPKDTWTDPGESILNTNPVVLNSRGEAVIYGSGDYRQVLKDADGNLIYDVLTQGTQSPSSETPTIVIETDVDGNGSTPGTGICSDVYVPFDCTIVSAVLQSTISGSVVVDIWKAPFGTGGTPPTISNSIVASDPPTLSSQQGSIDSVLTGWDKTIAAGSWLRFNINSISTLTRFTLTLNCTTTA